MMSFIYLESHKCLAYPIIPNIETPHENEIVCTVSIENQTYFPQAEGGTLLWTLWPLAMYRSPVVFPRVCSLVSLLPRDPGKLRSLNSPLASPSPAASGSLSRGALETPLPDASCVPVPPQAPPAEATCDLGVPGAMHDALRVSFS